MKDWLLKLALASIAALAPIHSILVSVFLLIIADLVTGVWAAKKQGQSISSSKLRNTVSKFFIYQMAIITAFVLETYLLEGAVPATKIVAGIIGLSEGVSVFENLNKISNTDLFKKLLTALGSANLPKQPTGSQNDSQKKQ